MKQEKRKETSIKDDLLFLILKILIFVVLLAVTFLFIFGICRISDNMMSPAFKDGDLAVLSSTDQPRSEEHTSNSSH